MSKLLTFLVASAILVSSLAFTNDSQGDDEQYGFVGAKKCGMCHKKDEDGAQLKKWEESAHAKAYENLKAHDAEAVKNDACLKCHATAAGVDASLLDKKFSIEDGVQCEACHGPGSEYKSMKVMKDVEQAKAKGLVTWANDEEIAAMCQTCHGDKPEGHPETPAFDFGTMYEKVKHNKPE